MGNQLRALIRKANGGSGLCYSSLIKMIYNCPEKLFCFPCLLNKLTSPITLYTPCGKLPNGFHSRNIIKQVCVAFLASFAVAAQDTSRLSGGSGGLVPQQQLWDLLSFGLHQGTSPSASPARTEGKAGSLLVSGRQPGLLRAWGKRPSRAAWKVSQAVQ